MIQRQKMLAPNEAVPDGTVKIVGSCADPPDASHATPCDEMNARCFPRGTIRRRDTDGGS
ncbi:hypothetical protein BN2475_120061 [Paraburkholderia ribeironis]|uniref:Uncharacterized protein n=1 Tax=Paraburkholderia ribeironis TaxID=1247936 RepID=A0A1N7RR13_9BURK|nr:hypothetical protein BN2475_120061 [Paraburkholderia ribeironis]